MQPTTKRKPFLIRLLLGSGTLVMGGMLLWMISAWVVGLMAGLLLFA